MAFLRASFNERVTLTESIVQGNIGSVYSSTFKTKPGGNFSAFVNTAGSATVGAIVCTVEASYDGVTFEEVMASFAADCNGATIVGKYFASVSGDYSFYRINMAAAANDSVTTLGVAIVGNCQAV